MTNRNTLFHLDGKKALITDASSNLGKHFAQVLSQHGAEVVVAEPSANKLHQLVNKIHSKGRKASAISLDVTNSRSVRDCFDQINDLIGGVDILVNNASISASKPAVAQSHADWNALLKTHFMGNWLMATEAARRLIAANRAGSIIHIAPIQSEQLSDNPASHSVYQAGLTQTTKTLALELARYAIRVNALMPGYIVTHLNHDFLNSQMGEKLRARIPTRRFGLPSDLDGPLLLLASDAGRHMTGACLAVDGGHLVSTLTPTGIEPPKKAIATK